MRTYAVAGSRAEVAVLLAHHISGILISFAMDPAGKTLSAIPAELPVLLDSGAFTAWRTGKEVDRDAFAFWVHQHGGRFSDVAAFNLDVIVGAEGTEAEREQAVIRSAENAEALRAAGVAVIEIYHLFEPLTVLDGILERRRPGEPIAFGGLAGQTGGVGFPVRRRFVAAAFEHLHQRYGWAALPNVHGLGVSPDGPIGGSVFPWTSVDCSSWMSIPWFGVRVTKSGKRLGGRTDTRTSNKNIAGIYAGRVLRRWERLDHQHAALWAARGLRTSPPPGDEVVSRA